MEYKRICPNCGRELVYQSYTAWYNANKANSLCRSCGCKKATKHCGNLEKLLEESFESYYWMGFLLADGCFSDDRLRIGLAIKDKEHLLKFAKFIDYTGTINEDATKISLAVKDIDIVNKICDKFDIDYQKTYNPPSTLEWINKDFIYCLLAGFIDGDGNIQHQNKRKDFLLRIKNHASWIDILKFFGSLITDKECVKINNKGYAELVVTNTTKLQELKEKVLAYNIPILSRKWDIIDMNFISKYTKAEEIRNKVIELLNKNIKQVEIAKQLGISQSNVTKIKKNYYETINN